MERITKAAVRRMCRKQERENIKRKGCSYTWGTIEDIICRGYLEEIEEDNGILIMNDGWRQHLKEIY